MSSDGSDDDFGPVISPPLKREKPEEVAPVCPEDAIGGNAPEPTTDGSPTVEQRTAITATVVEGDAPSEPPATTPRTAEKSPADVQWSFYHARSDMPCAPLYERSFLHDRVVEASASSTATTSSTTTTTAAAVADVAVLEDSLGVLVCSVDAVGVVRVWRMLPSGGLFFLGQQNRIFPPPPTTSVVAESDAGGSSGHSSNRFFYVCANTMMQWLILVCVTEEEKEQSASSAAAEVVVHVEARRLNSLTLTVEAKSECSFAVPADSTEDGPVRGCYTRRPFLLQHRYEPHLALFTAMEKGPDGTASGSGVVLFPCFPTVAGVAAVNDHDNSDDTNSLLAPRRRMFKATRLSTAHVVVACAQHARMDGGGCGINGDSGRGASSSFSAASSAFASPALVLVDEKGILDYATIEPVPLDEGEGGGGVTGLALKVMAGLAACLPNSPTARVWQQWICFDRRQRTGFFSLLRDVQKVTAALPEPTSATACGVHALPLGVCLSPTGRYLVVASLTVRATLLKEDRRTNTYQVTSTPEVYVFDFPTGQCLGRAASDSNSSRIPDVSCTETIVLARGPQSSTRKMQEKELFQRHVGQLARTSLVGLYVAESSAVRREADGHVCRGLYILIPRVNLGTSSSSSSSSSSDSSSVEKEVVGRPLLVYQVALPPKKRSTPHSDNNNTTSAEVIRLPRVVGELECLVSGWKGPSHPLHDSSCPTASATIAVESVRAPLMVIRRCVAPSQDLKNLVGRSPTGAALSAEELKKLVFTVSSRSEEKAKAAAVATDCNNNGSNGAAGAYSSVIDRVALTTSMGSGTAMLAYVSAAASSSPTTAHLSSINRAADRLARLAALEQGENDGGEAEGPVGAVGEWRELCNELRAQRSFQCGRLLSFSADVIAGQSQQQHGGEDGGEENSHAQQHSTDAAETQEGGGQVEAESAAEDKAPQSHQQQQLLHPRTPAQQEEAAVLVLLRDALSTLPSQPSPPPPRGFLAVRGHGMVQVHFLPQVAPLAVRSFVALARRGYYTGLTFHRVIPGMMIQGGCPQGDGTGGESGLDGGAAFPDEGLELFPFFSHTQQHMWLCMANAGKDTNGSQFFITVPGSGEQVKGLSWLNGCHTVFGYVVGGANVVQAVSLVPRDEQDKPLRPVVIERIDVL